MSYRRLSLLMVLAFLAGVLARSLEQDRRDGEHAEKLAAEVRERSRIEEETLYRATLCPLDWKAQIIQRYDDRDRRGRIIKKTWIRKCI